MRGLPYAVVLCFSCLACLAQGLRVATWNVENLFDTCHDEGWRDWDFLPGAERGWNGGRYWRKLRDVTQTLAAMGLPDIVALQEVENDTVLRDLTRRTALWSAGYGYVVTEGPDERGADVGLLFRREAFRLSCFRGVRVPSAAHGLRATRDLLYAVGVLPAGDTLHVIAVHFPSRRSGGAAGRRNRALAAETLRGMVDSVYRACHAGEDGCRDVVCGRCPKIVVMGDFNAEPGDEVFGMTGDRLVSLVVQDRRRLRGVEGTYYFKGVWGYLDHILVSPPLSGFACGRARECRFPFLLRGRGQVPARTYGGVHYLGGVSDHLPLVADFLFAAPAE